VEEYALMHGKSHTRPTIFALICVITLLGALVRFHGLSERTMTHIEIYVPGIDLPAELAIPKPRFTVRETMDVSMEERDPHPPAYYLLMLAWTRRLGSTLFSLRLPSVLFGLASIPLAYALGLLNKQRAAGLLAAAMLALNGQQVFWSQLAKSYAMGCFLGLLATVLLVLASKAGARQRLLQVLYVVTVLAGVSTTPFFWPLLATHMLWTIATGWSQKTAPGLLRLELLATIMGSPLISFAIFQSRRDSHVHGGILAVLGEYLEFGFLFVRDTNSAPTLVPAVAGILLPVVSLLLLGLSTARRPNDRSSDSSTVTSGPPWVLVWLGSLLTCLVILALAQYSREFHALKAILVAGSACVPVLLAAAAHLVHAKWLWLKALWDRLMTKLPPHALLLTGGLIASVLAAAGFVAGFGDHHRLGHRFTNLAMLGVLMCALGVVAAVFRRRRIKMRDDPVFLLATLPVCMTMAVSPAVHMFVPRGMFLFSPYLLLVLAQALVRLTRRSNLYWVLPAGLLLIAHPLSVLHFRHSHHEHPNDYQGLALKWTPEIDDSDLIFVARHWATTPIYYYLKGDRFHLVGRDYAEAIQEHPDARVWVLRFEEIPMRPEMKDALEGFEIRKTIEARWIRAVLYSRPGPTPGTGEP